MSSLCRRLFFRSFYLLICFYSSSSVFYLRVRFPNNYTNSIDSKWIIEWTIYFRFYFEFCMKVDASFMCNAYCASLESKEAYFFFKWNKWMIMGSSNESAYFHFRTVMHWTSEWKTLKISNAFQHHKSHLNRLCSFLQLKNSQLRFTNSHSNNWFSVCMPTAHAC